MIGTGEPARVAVLGSINVDIAVRSRHLPQPGQTLHGDSFALTLGGKGANQAAASARLGASVAFVGCTGDDAFGALARDRLSAFGLDMSHIRTDRERGTGIATIAIDAAGENAITIVAGANASVSQEDAEAARAELSQARVLLLQCETPFAASIAAARIVREAGGIVILDPAPAPEGGIPAEMLALADFVTPNETESRALTGITVSSPESALAAARKLREMGAHGAIVKLGGAGMVYSLAAGEGFLPAFAVEVVDTVAAGDCFNAGLAVALAEGAGFGGALCFAAACGALAVTKSGAAEAAPRRSEVMEMLKSPA